MPNPGDETRRKTAKALQCIEEEKAAEPQKKQEEFEQFKRDVHSITLSFVEKCRVEIDKAAGTGKHCAEVAAYQEKSQCVLLGQKYRRLDYTTRERGLSLLLEEAAAILIKDGYTVSTVSATSYYEHDDMPVTELVWYLVIEW